MPLISTPQLHNVIMSLSGNRYISTQDSLPNVLPPFQSLALALSYLFPSSSCSLTRRSGSSAGMILRGSAPGTTEYFEKSVTPAWSRKKSSSRTSSPLTFAAGARRISRMASEKIVGLRRSFDSSAFAAWNFWVAADSMAYDGLLLVYGVQCMLNMAEDIRLMCRTLMRPRSMLSFQEEDYKKKKIEEKRQHTAAGQILVMAMSSNPCRTRSMARPFVRTLMPTFPMA